MKIQYSIKTRLAVWITVALWASAFVGIRAGLESYTPGSLAALRFLVASFCMLILYMRLPNRNRISWRDKGWLILIGITGIGFYQLALNYGEISVSSGIASFIISLSPVITLIFAVIFLREAVTINMVFGMTVSVIGVFLIMLGKVNQSDFHVGVCFVLIAAIIGGIYSVVQKPFLKKYHAIEVTAYIIWGATIFLLIYLPNVLHEGKFASLQATLAVIYLGIFPAAIGYILWSYCLKEMPASTAVNYLYFMPLIATFLGWLYLHEMPALLSLIGGFVTLLGVWIVSHPRQKKIEYPV